jgi:magnesium transporter
MSAPDEDRDDAIPVKAGDGDVGSPRSGRTERGSSRAERTGRSERVGSRPDSRLGSFADDDDGAGNRRDTSRADFAGGEDSQPGDFEAGEDSRPGDFEGGEDSRPGDRERVADTLLDADPGDTVVDGDGSGLRPAGNGDGFLLASESNDEAFDAAEVAEVTQEIRAVAVSRADDNQLPELSERSSEQPAPPRPGEPEPLDVDELRDAWPLLDLEERSDGLHILPREDAEDFYIGLPSKDQAALLLHWRPGHRRQWMRLLEPDDAADVIQEVPEHQRSALLTLLDAPTRKEVQALLAYEEDEAGGLMNTRYARLRPRMTVDEAVAYLRRQARGQLETIYDAFVLDAGQHLLGMVSFRDLLIAPPSKTVADIMETDVVRVNDEMDQATLSRIFAEHDLTVIPVVDAEGRMEGIVTVDDIVDVVQEEATEDAQKFGGMQALDQPYLQSGLREMVEKRAVWLIVLLFGQMLTATALGYFQGQIEAAVVLTLFMPLVISSGGNSGSQASTLVIRAMALGELRPRDFFRVVRREIMTGLALGLLLGVFGTLRVILWPTAASTYGQYYVLLGFTVGISLVCAVIFGTLVGSMLPFLLRRIGADPASASAPFVATLSDVTGLIIYFTVANLILAGTML